MIWYNVSTPQHTRQNIAEAPGYDYEIVFVGLFRVNLFGNLYCSAQTRKNKIQTYLGNMAGEGDFQFQLQPLQVLSCNMLSCLFLVGNDTCSIFLSRVISWCHCYKGITNFHLRITYSNDIRSIFDAYIHIDHTFEMGIGYHLYTGLHLHRPRCYKYRLYRSVCHVEGCWIFPTQIIDDRCSSQANTKTSQVISKMD